MSSQLVEAAAPPASIRAPEQSVGRAFPRPAYAWYVVGVLTVASMSSFVDRQIPSLLVGPIRRDLGISDTQVSLLMGLSFALFYTFLGLPLGRLADSRSRRGIIGAGIAAWSVMTAACGLANTYPQLLLARVGVGVGEAALAPAAHSLIADFFPRERLAAAMSVYSAGIFLGTGVAVLVGGAVVGLLTDTGVWDLPLLGAIYPWQSVFFVVGLPGIGIALLMRTVREVPRLGTATRAGLPLRDVAGFIRAHRRVFLSHHLGFAMFTLLGQATVAWAPTFFIRTYGWSAAQAGIRFGLVVITFGTLGIITGGKYADALARRGRRDAKMLIGVVAALATALCTALYPLMPSGWGALATMVPMLFFASFPIGAAAAAVQEVTPRSMRAQASAFFLFTTSLLGYTLGPTAVALVTDYVFANDAAVRYSLALVSTAAMLAAAALLRVGLVPYRRLAAARAD